ncbi:alpha/beta fold hydrolase [Entomomonas asaccharolytica]|uniref:Alpha/beta hydrolase n=1 Tax=Entomomonas asaccharolytica TaxID=2785331 RepID=A0A974NG88_9GAMM|nr:alpha/beta hydrolase [Entomomonas asaccharolytica]QQP85973.1 alpha/beta hydrolase [Entomomonas asaccharolytica]
MISSELPTLVLIPGLLCDERLWQHQVVNLADVCKPCVADISQDNSIRAMAKRVLEKAPQRFILTALSMGGYVAFEIMRQAPERVICLALIDTMARLDDDESIALRKGLIKLAEEGRFVGVTPRLLPNIIYKDKLNTPIADEIINMAARLGKETFIRQQTAIITRDDSLPTLSTINVPTLIIVGEEDKRTPPEESRIMAETIANAELHMLPKCGHLPPLELPQVTTTLLKEWIVKNTQ